MNAVLDDPASAIRREWRSQSLHALNSPLGAILTQAELVHLLASRGRTDEALATATNIVNDCERYARVLRHAFAAMEAVDTYAPGHCKVADALASVSGALDAADIAIDVNGGDVMLPWSLQAAASFFSRCFDNAGRHGARAVSVTVAKDDDVVRIHVRDDGTGLQGLSAEAALRCYVSSTPATHSGLGLWIARALARRAGGDVFLPPTARGFLVECVLPAGPSRP